MCHSVCRYLLRCLLLLDRFADLTCRLAISAMTLLVLVQVVLRYVVRAPLSWVEEATVFLMIWVTFIGAGRALRLGEHIAMTLARDRLPKRFVDTLRALSHLAILSFVALLAYHGWRLALSAEGQRSPALAIPMAWPYFIIPLGALFMFTQQIAVIIESSTSRPADETVANKE